jgi:hypothetical protein
LSEITPEWLSAWRDLVLERYAPGTMRRYLEARNGLFEHWKAEEDAH